MGRGDGHGGVRTKQSARKDETTKFMIATKACYFKARNPKPDNSKQPIEAPPAEPVRPTKTNKTVWEAMSKANKIKNAAKAEKMMKPKTLKMSAAVWTSKTKSEKQKIKKTSANAQARQLYSCFKK